MLHNSGQSNLATMSEPELTDPGDPGDPGKPMAEAAAAAPDENSGDIAANQCHNYDDDDVERGREDTSETDSTCTILNQLIVQCPPMESLDEADRREAANGENKRKVSLCELPLSIDNLPEISSIDQDRTAGFVEEITRGDTKSVSEKSRRRPPHRNQSEDKEEDELIEIDLNEQEDDIIKRSDCNTRTSRDCKINQPEARESVQMFSPSYRRDGDNDDEPNVVSMANSNPMATTTILNQHHYHLQQQQQQQQHYLAASQQFRGFGEAQPKLSFASKRMKEYFESFRGRRSETVRLYQFFKSTRTELVACLLFSLISSQALIVLKSNLTDQGASWPSGSLAVATQGQHPRGSQGSNKVGNNDGLSPDAAAAVASGSASGSVSSGSNGDDDPMAATVGAAQISSHSTSSKATIVVQLANGLVMSFTVASLTQVFGHISGCHLIPSVSLALYIKGHISRARLASYLVAQFLGSGLGVGLLGLLSSSQLSPDEYGTLLQSSSLKYHPHPNAQGFAGWQSNSTGDYLPISMKGGGNNNLRSKREASSPLMVTTGQQQSETASGDPVTFSVVDGSSSGSGSGSSGPDDDDVNLKEFQGSETILLSIMEQQQQQLQLQQQTTRNPDKTIHSPHLDDGKTITVNASTSRPKPPATRGPPQVPELPGAMELESKQLAGNPATSPIQTTTPKPPSTVATAANPAATVIVATSSSLPEPSSSSSTGRPTKFNAGQVWTSSGSTTTGQYLSGSDVRGEPRVAGPNVAAMPGANPSAPNDGSRAVSQFELAGGIPTSSSGPPDAAAAAAAAAISSSEPSPVGQAAGSPEASQQQQVTVEASELQALLQAGELQSAGALIGSNPEQDVVDVKRLTKLRRRKRNRQQHQQHLREVNSATSGATLLASSSSQASNNASNGSTINNNVGPFTETDGQQQGKHYINLLEFALPDQIMSGESIRQCIDNQQPPPAASRISPPGRLKEQQEAILHQLASSSFGQCLSLSNSSQMFVFQFLATLLVVLTYLVNVDPRRIDQGFKSLSIGLAYFVGCVLTVHSGGFFGNPFHLVFVNWLSTTSEWRSEWFIYLVTPFISGLFGAISHEYIDFSSLRNRNRQLHLRRSFYSLDNLAQIVATTNESNALVGGSHAKVAASASASANAGQRSDSHATVVEISSLNGAIRRPRKVSSSSSSSPESMGAASSSMMSLNGPDPVPSASIVLEQQHQLNHINLNNHLSGGAGAGGAANHHHYSNINPTHSHQQQQQQQRLASESFGTNRKLISYSRQLRLEQQREAAAAGATQCHQIHVGPNKQVAAPTRTSLRRSDFDSNFLISSSCSTPPPAAVRRQIHTSGWM